MKPTIYSFPDGYPHGLKKDDFMDWLVHDWVQNDSNYYDFVWDKYEDLGGETECNDDGIITDYDLDLYLKAEKIVLKEHLYDDTEWKEDYWKNYLANYEYTYFIGEGEPF